MSIFLLAVPLGMALGWALGGRLERLASLPLRGGWLCIAAVALQVVAFPSGLLPWTIADGAASVLWLCSYALLAAAAVLNRRLPGARLAAAGMLMNLAAIVSNGGHMPALPRALQAAGLSYTAVRNNSIADAHPHLALLVDRFAAPSWLPWANVLSLGDLVIAAGAAVLVAAGMGARPPRLRRAARA
jgi:Family of unknown function (DUF5317)